MKKIILLYSLIFSLLIVSRPALVQAEDAPNTNVTRRRPDKSPIISPSPVGADYHPPSTSDIKQVSSPKPWYTRLWERLVSFFQ